MSETDERGDGGPDDAADRERRERALRALAQDQAATPRGEASAAPPGAHDRPRFAAARHDRGGPTPPRRRRYVLAGLAVILAAAIVGAALLHARGQGNQPGTATRARSHPITPALDQLRCEQDLAWSPDGRRVGILGYQTACPQDIPDNYAYWPGLVNLYDSASGNLLGQIQPDQAITAALHLRAPTDATPMPTSPRGDTSAQVIAYTHLQWSPDGATLALSFVVRVAEGAERTDTTIGLLLVGQADGTTRVLAHPVGPGESAWGEWDLVTGAYVPASQPTRAPDRTVHWLMSTTLPAPALSYTWGAGGALMPGTALSSTAAPAPPSPGPVGNPNGGATFTIWQPGSVDRQTEYGAARQSHIPGAQEFSTSFLAWSPNGRYVLAAEAQDWRIQAAGLPAPTAAALRDFGLAGAPVLPARDAALAVLLRSLPANQKHLDTTHAVAVAWSPDGRWLGVLQSPPITPTTPQAVLYRVTIYNCATGGVAGQVTPGLAANLAQSGVGPYVRWSPDSTRLLIFDEQLGVVTIAGPGQLPR